MANRRGMNPLLKKVLAAVAIKQVVDRVQEARAPRHGFIRRNFGKLVLLGLVGGGLYAYKSGKFEQLLGGGSTGYKDAYPTGPGTQPIPSHLDASDETLETTSI
jgi:hypothetical protein